MGINNLQGMFYAVFKGITKMLDFLGPANDVGALRKKE